MIRTKVLSILAGTMIVSLSVPAFAQEETPNGRNEITVQALGSFVKSTNNNGVEQSATNSGGVLASYRFFFNSWNGVEANYGYSLNTQDYNFGSGRSGVTSHSHEFSGAYGCPADVGRRLCLPGPAGWCLIQRTSRVPAPRRGLRSYTGAAQTSISRNASTFAPSTAGSFMTHRHSVYRVSTARRA